MVSAGRSRISPAEDHPLRLLRAWDTTEDSDVDVLVVMSLGLGQREVLQAAAIRDRVRAPFPMDVIVRSPEKVARRLAQGDGFIAEVLHHGRLMYESKHP